MHICKTDKLAACGYIYISCVAVGRHAFMLVSIQLLYCWWDICRFTDLFKLAISSRFQGYDLFASFAGIQLYGRTSSESFNNTHSTKLVQNSSKSYARTKRTHIMKCDELIMMGTKLQASIYYFASEDDKDNFTLEGVES